MPSTTSARACPSCSSTASSCSALPTTSPSTRGDAGRRQRSERRPPSSRSGRADETTATVLGDGGRELGDPPVSPPRSRALDAGGELAVALGGAPLRLSDTRPEPPHWTPCAPSSSPSTEGPRSSPSPRSRTRSRAPTRSWSASPTARAIGPTRCSAWAPIPILSAVSTRSSVWSTPGRSKRSATRVVDWHVGDRVMGIEAGACHAELVVTHERQALPVPSTIELSDAAAIPEVFLTAWDALVVQGGLTSGRWALVHAGASGVGTAAIQIAEGDRRTHRRHVLAGKMQACRDLGADLVLERSPADWAAELREAVPGGVDVDPRRGRWRRGQPQPGVRSSAGHDRPGRSDGRWPDVGQPRAAAREARSLDRHHLAIAADRAEGDSVPTLHRRGDPACSSPVPCGR